MAAPPFRAAHNRSQGASQDPRELPLYNVTEAARFAGVSTRALEAWMRPVGCGAQLSRPLLQPADPVSGLLSFANLVDAHLLEVTRKHGFPIRDVSMAIGALQGTDHSTPHPLLTAKFERDGKRMFVSSLSETVTNSGSATGRSRGQIRFVEDLDRYLGRIDRDENGDPYQLFPMRRNENKGVAVNINLLAGQPVVTGTGFRVQHLVELMDRANMSIGEIAEQYALDHVALVEAIDFIAS